MPSFYDGTKLLSLKDINGDAPEIFICTSNRSAGKTTYFNRLMINRFLRKGEKFACIYRFNYELEGVETKFFKDIKRLFFPSYDMGCTMYGRGIFAELTLNDELCGYAISLNNADQLKKYSHVFSDVKTLIFDEFMSETNKYCPNEVEKLLSIHTSMARGAGEQSRYLPIIMISNPVSLLNPYYGALGISARLKTDTHFLKGEGFVLEQGFNESASEAQKHSAFNRAFAGSHYMAYANEGIYLNDSYSFIERPQGKSRYLCTLRYKGNDFAVREFTDLGIIYCDDRADLSFPNRLAVTTEDHKINYVLLTNKKSSIAVFKTFFEHGCFRFKNLPSKECIMALLSF